VDITLDLAWNLACGLVSGIIVAAVLTCQARRRWAPVREYEMLGPRSRLRLWAWSFARLHGVDMDSAPIATSRPSLLLKQLPSDFWEPSAFPRLVLALNEGEAALQEFEDAYRRLPLDVRDPRLPTRAREAKIALGDYKDILCDAISSPADPNTQDSASQAGVRCKAALLAFWSAFGDKPPASENRDRGWINGILATFRPRNPK
jgi:hypothetical protein